jgi:hypothetical protein
VHEAKAKQEVRRRSAEAELWRTAFARGKDQICFSLKAGLPAVAPASAGRRLEARGVEPLFPACYDQRSPRMVYQSHLRGEYVFVDMRGRIRMLLVLLLGSQRLETSGIAVLDSRRAS